MILKTSFFNKAIYKSTIKRYTWGGILYFILLFISTSLSLFLNIEKDFSHMPDGYFKEYPVILHSQYITVPVLLAIIVPTVAALLIFRFLHSKKQAIFIHSIPVSKKANYISSVLAGFTLMYLPVILNGLLLIIISVCGYSYYFTVFDCLKWIGYNILGIFLMFSISIFSATITGNSFATIVINILIHSCLFLITATFDVMADVFIYGYASENLVYEILFDNNFAVIVYGFMDKYFRAKYSLLDYTLYLLIAFLIYIISYYIYKLRKAETASDVAGFKSLNSIFKYLVTFLVTIFGFTIFDSYIDSNIIVFSIILFIISVVGYSATEMILKKTINVLYSWKGYIGFASIYLLIIAIFSQTSFFGYETNIPQTNDINKATLYNYYQGASEPFTANNEIINIIKDTHQKAIEKNIPKIKQQSLYQREDYTSIHIKYQLKNGKAIHRRYPISSNECNEIMNTLYSYDEYKKICEPVFVEDSLINSIYLNHEILIKEPFEFINVVREDVLNMSYEQLHPVNYVSTDYGITIEQKEELPIIIKGIPQTTSVRREYYQISNEYHKTIEWLTKKGYINNQQ